MAFQDRKLLPSGEVLGGQLGAVGSDASNPNKGNPQHAHFTGLRWLLIRHEGMQEGHERQCCKCFIDNEYGINRRDTWREFH